MINESRRQGDKPMGRFAVEITLVNKRDRILAEAGAIPDDDVRQTTLRGTVDSGAARLVLPESVADQLGLEEAPEATVRYADQRTATRRTAQELRLRLLDREGVFSAILEPDRTTALIGAIVLEELDLLIDCANETLYPRDPNRIVAEIE